MLSPSQVHFTKGKHRVPRLSLLDLPGRQSRHTLLGSWNTYGVRQLAIRVFGQIYARGVSVTTTRLPALVDGVQARPRAERLETSRGGVRFLQLVKDVRDVWLYTKSARNLEYLDDSHCSGPSSRATWSCLHTCPVASAP